MNQASDLVLIILGLCALLTLGTFGVLSKREGERRAMRVALIAAIVASLPFFLAILLPATFKLIMLSATAAVGVATAVLLLWPAGQVERSYDVPSQRFDERDQMFARAKLAPGSPEYKAYYTRRPELRAFDDEIRTLPGLHSPNAPMMASKPLAFASIDAGFAVTRKLLDAVNGPVTPQRPEIVPAEITAAVKALAGYYGAFTVGITELKPYHLYSHVGMRSNEYGNLIEHNHHFAIVFTVLMDYTMVGTAPTAVAEMEVARQYVQAAQIATQLGYAIRALGYPARAHILDSYLVILPLLARDAGLGQVGRMGILMTPQVGPRVRLGAVTTDMPLIPDQCQVDTSMIDFCRVCLKCAACCPAQAISWGDREEHDGALRWRINPDKCFRYWNRIGTDCGRCVAVCPYSHADNLMHNAMRWATQRSGLARRAAVRLDDVFYGRRPAPRFAPGWVAPPSSEEIDTPGN